LLNDVAVPPDLLDVAFFILGIEPGLDLDDGVLSFADVILPPFLIPVDAAGVVFRFNDAK
jgi:hypothetical protein